MLTTRGIDSKTKEQQHAASRALVQFPTQMASMDLPVRLSTTICGPPGLEKFPGQIPGQPDFFIPYGDSSGDEALERRPLLHQHQRWAPPQSKEEFLEIGRKVFSSMFLFVVFMWSSLLVITNSWNLKFRGKPFEIPNHFA